MTGRGKQEVNKLVNNKKLLNNKLKRRTENAFCEYITNVAETNGTWILDHMVEYITTALS